jgi:hypothetical protein
LNPYAENGKKAAFFGRLFALQFLELATNCLTLLSRFVIKIFLLGREFQGVKEKAMVSKKDIDKGWLIG